MTAQNKLFLLLKLLLDLFEQICDFVASEDNFVSEVIRNHADAGSATFTELLKNAGLKSPFDENTLRGACEKAKEYLDNFEITWAQNKCSYKAEFCVILTPKEPTICGTS